MKQFDFVMANDTALLNHEDFFFFCSQSEVGFHNKWGKRVNKAKIKRMWQCPLEGQEELSPSNPEATCHKPLEAPTGSL